MKAYVDELPKSCWECIFADNQKGYCDLLETRILRQFTRRAIGCPLKSLADHDKQVRKQICEKINAELYNKMVLYNKKLEYSDIALILDQLQGENNG